MKEFNKFHGIIFFIEFSRPYLESDHCTEDNCSVFLYKLRFRLPTRSSRLRNSFQMERYKSNYRLNKPVSSSSRVCNELNIDYFQIIYWDLFRI